MMDTYTITQKLKFYKNGNRKAVESVYVSLEHTDEHANLYGIALTGFELNWFNTHYSIWQDFLSHSKADYCLIKSSSVRLNVNVEQIESYLNSTETDFHVFFPYDHIHADPGSRVPMALSRLGFFWGTECYFVSRKKIDEMIAYCSIISLPLDEQLLALGIEKKIRFVYNHTGWVQFQQERSASFIARKKSIITYIKSYTAWNKKEMVQVRDILTYLAQIAIEEDVKIFLHAGTLLGSVRHGEIMKWDDDVDLMVHKEDLIFLVDRIRKDGIYQVTEWIWQKTEKIYYKIWKHGGYKVDGYAYSFPFVDIWWLEESGDTVITNDGYVFDKGVYFPLRQVAFENNPYYHPNVSEVILDEMYPEWNKFIKVFSWSHKYKKHAVKQMTIPIRTDNRGQFIDYL